MTTPIKQIISLSFRTMLGLQDEPSFLFLTVLELYNFPKRSTKKYFGKISVAYMRTVIHECHSYFATGNIALRVKGLPGKRKNRSFSHISLDLGLKLCRYFWPKNPKI